MLNLLIGDRGDICKHGDEYKGRLKENEAPEPTI
ncbi:hypothetical protein BVRB_4g096740 [Beta vulgaris subsp. vulgaris]|uniref:Uncharacterized protein n=1 Tax=Beta vulgaris subsp. vulgaris TaxID=3555 RepID=A0A0J8BDF6_BETVV|nr:hypothetical protein BVRB_4g096740 [Beta vulgaris subsp. vulgaris]